MAAYNLWSNADFAACLREIDRAATSLDPAERIEAALLRARSYLRLDRPNEALAALDIDEGIVSDVDVRCAVATLRGHSLVSAGQSKRGMELLRTTVADADDQHVDLSMRLEAAYQLGFGHWLLGEFESAESIARRVADSGSDIISARAVALRGWVCVGRTRYAEACAFFHAALSRCGRCVARDAAFEASLVHAIATYELQCLEHGDDPRYYLDTLPKVAGSALDTYRLLIGIVDAERAALAGDESRAIDEAVATDATDVTAPWRTFALAGRARIARAFGHKHFARATSLAAFAVARDLDWDRSPAESRLALLDLAEELAPADIEKAKGCLSSFARMNTAIDSRYFGGLHPLHSARIKHAYGAVGVHAGDGSGSGHLLDAASAYSKLGFSWRAAETQLLLAADSSLVGQRAYREARSFIVERFPRSHLALALGDYTPPIVVDARFALTQSQTDIIRSLCAGSSVRSVALQRGTAVGTVYNQLKDIYRRTGFHSVGDLVRHFRAASA